MPLSLYFFHCLNILFDFMRGSAWSKFKKKVWINLQNHFYFSPRRLSILPWSLALWHCAQQMQNIKYLGGFLYKNLFPIASSRNQEEGGEKRFLPIRLWRRSWPLLRWFPPLLAWSAALGFDKFPPQSKGQLRKLKCLR